MKSPLAIVLEAKKKNQVDPDETDDFTEEVEDEDTPETDEETTEEDDTIDPDTNTDFTQEIPDDDEESDDTGGEEGEEAPVEGEEGDDTGGDEPADFTSEVDSDTEGGDEEISPTDDTTPEGGDETTEEEPQDDDEKRNLMLLHEDFMNLYESTKAIIQKLNSFDNSNAIMNTVCIQIIKNLSSLKSLIWNHIMYDYDKSNYVSNLHKYNYFIEALVINTTMLKKTKVFVSDLENK